MHTDRMLYLVTEYAAGGEIFGKPIFSGFTLLLAPFRLS